MSLLFVMRTTDDLGIRVPHDISPTVLNLGLVFLTQNHIVHLVNVFICVHTSLSTAALTSVHCACVSELLEQPVNATFRPSFAWKYFPQLSYIISLQLIYFLIRISSSSLKTMFTDNAVTYDTWDDVTSDCQIKYVRVMVM